MKAKEPPTIAGRRVPKVVCKSVLMPDTNKIVWMTLDLSACHVYEMPR